MEEVVSLRQLKPEEVCVEVAVGVINPKDTSSLLEQLSSAAPLHRYALSHLKRVRRSESQGGSGADGGGGPKLELLLCPASELEELPADLRAKVQSTSSVRVCRVPPQSRAEYEEWNGWWPTNFRPNEVDREREKGHSAEELQTVADFMRLVAQDAERCREFYGPGSNGGDGNGDGSDGFDCVGGAGGPASGGGVMVNPANNRVVSSCHDVLLYRHGAEQQARAAAAAACSSGEGGKVEGEGKGGARPTRLQLSMRAPTLLCIDGTALVVNHGAAFACHSAAAAVPAADMSSPLLPADAYLCTGLDLYLTQEPNLLSAMALVHSRIRRVFFLEAQPAHGALASRHHIHALRALNHKYRVFHVSPALLLSPSPPPAPSPPAPA